jgi:single stranded DNA-binding protein
MKNQVSNNNARIFGTVTSAPVVKVSATGKHMATCRLVSYEKVTDEAGVSKNKKVWRNIVAWGKTADFLQRTFEVGRKVSVECTERKGSYTDQNGKQKTVHEFNVNKVLHLGEVKVPAIKIGADC